MPYEGEVEFGVAQARSFAQKILSALDVVDGGWVGKSTGSQDACDD